MIRARCGGRWVGLGKGGVLKSESANNEAILRLVIRGRCEIITTKVAGNGGVVCMPARPDRGSVCIGVDAVAFTRWDSRP